VINKKVLTILAIAFIVVSQLLVYSMMTNNFERTIVESTQLYEQLKDSPDPAKQHEAKVNLEKAKTAAKAKAGAKYALYIAMAFTAFGGIGTYYYFVVKDAKYF